MAKHSQTRRSDRSRLMPELRKTLRQRACDEFEARGVMGSHVAGDYSGRCYHCTIRFPRSWETDGNVAQVTFPAPQDLGGAGGPW